MFERMFTFCTRLFKKKIFISLNRVVVHMVHRNTVSQMSTHFGCTSLSQFQIPLEKETYASFLSSGRLSLWMFFNFFN